MEFVTEQTEDELLKWRDFEQEFFKEAAADDIRAGALVSKVAFDELSEAAPKEADVTKCESLKGGLPDGIDWLKDIDNVKIKLVDLVNHAKGTVLKAKEIKDLRPSAERILKATSRVLFQMWPCASSNGLMLV